MSQQAGTVASLYSVHPGVASVQARETSLPEKTGRSRKAWIALVEKEGPATEEERWAWLKATHGPGTNAAWWIAERAARYVEALYAGSKSGLRPLHDRLVDLGKSLGADVRVCPCKTFVPLSRRYVFAQIKPSTRTRIDLGLALKNAVEALYACSTPAAPPKATASPIASRSLRSMTSTRKSNAGSRSPTTSMRNPRVMATFTYEIRRARAADIPLLPGGKRT